MNKSKPKKPYHVPFSVDEKRKYYETVKGSARVHRNRKKYYRPEDKHKRDD